VLFVVDYVTSDTYDFGTNQKWVLSAAPERERLFRMRPPPPRSRRTRDLIDP